MVSGGIICLSGSRPDTLSALFRQAMPDMSLDPHFLDLMRDHLSGEAVSEKKMFGGICFLTAGNMICGLHKDGAMFRVGPLAEAEARALPGTGPMLFTGRPMKGFVDAGEEALADEPTRARLMAMALAYARSLPPK
jgi:TfoX/Sxy family transcriptional regulator of competence genes